MKLAAPLVTWQNSYALGLEEIDEQHKMLFDIMNRIWEGIVRNADATTIGSALEDLDGTGMTTSSPGPQKAAMARNTASLAPTVTSTSSVAR